VGIGEFFTWWRGELAGMLPDTWRRRLERRHDTLLLVPDGDQVRVGRRDNGRVEELGSIDTTLPGAGGQVASMLSGLSPASTRVEVAVPPEKLLVKQILLPAAAEENLRQVLGFEMQRQTPFRVEQVFFNHRVTARRPESRQIAVQLSVVPRGVVEGVLNSLVDWDLVPAADNGRVEQGDGIFSFAPSDAAQRPSSRLKGGLVILNLALLVCVVAIPLAQQQRHLDRLHARFDEVRTAATAASGLQERIDRHGARSRYLYARKAEHPASVELLEELSRRLPDDTWLFRLEMRDGNVFLQGTSARASSLIGELEQSRFLEGVQFASPVTQDGASGRERFHVSARVAARPAQTVTGDVAGTGT
jgi:general secretion pathway protein L